MTDTSKLDDLIKTTRAEAEDTKIRIKRKCRTSPAYVDQPFMRCCAQFVMLFVCLDFMFQSTDKRMSNLAGSHHQPVASLRLFLLSGRINGGDLSGAAAQRVLIGVVVI